MYSLSQIQKQLEEAKLAGNIYNQDNLLVLQAPWQDDGSALNVFAQHEHTTEQIGLQFGLKISDSKIDYLIGFTLSNQDRSYEISAGNLKGDQSAFNLIYAFYNFPKRFYLVEMPLNARSDEIEYALERQLFSKAELAFIEQSLKINPHGEHIQWIKKFVLQQVFDMKVRLQLALNH